MKPIRLSIGLTKINGSRVVQMNDKEGNKKIYACVPIEKCFIPKQSSDAYLIAMAIETPNSLYSDFIIKEYVEQDVYENMTPEERIAVANLGRGRFIKERPNKVLVHNTDNVDEDVVDMDINPIE